VKARTGIKHDVGKPRTDLLPFDALVEVADVLDYGARKYADRNWERGMAWGRMFGAALRHLFAWASGQERDPESGRLHLSHAACCVLMLLALTLRKTGTDDRRLASDTERLVIGPTVDKRGQVVGRL
jgi:hypothetical protein